MSDDTLDQWLTSAIAAMAFALANWRQFCEEIEGITGDRVPITPANMQKHALHLADLCDPKRMPHG